MATETTKYNGWTNYETWCVNLWMTGDQPSDKRWRQVARRAWESAKADATFSRSENARITLAEWLDQEITAGNPVEGATLWSDLVNSALSEVDWHELANAFLADMEGYELQS